MGLTLLMVKVAISSYVAAPFALKLHLGMCYCCIGPILQQFECVVGMDWNGWHFGLRLQHNMYNNMVIDACSSVCIQRPEVCACN